jgi:DNA-binding NtrC family response regulator
MTLHSEDSPPAAKPSNIARLTAWRLLGRACRAAAGRSGIQTLLQLALEATGAERAYLVERRNDAEPAVQEVCSRRSDGLERPSRTALLCAAAREQTFICSDVEEHRHLAEGASVRSLRLRTVLSATLPSATGRHLLLLDSRLDPPLPGPQLRELLECFASLLALAPRERPSLPPPDDDLAGEAAPFREMLAWVRRVAGSELPVLIQGETGSGKEGIARRLHLQSDRAEGPFVPVNCTALAETLLDSELFGSLRGSYTGADRDRPGLFRLANRGSLFLDEIGDTSPALQAKLLRAIQEKRVRPVGGEQEIPVDARIIAATNQDLPRQVREGCFRADLYHRLAMLEVDVPPLRERLEDLPLLVERLAPRIEQETSCRPLRLAPGAWRRLRAHAWPGNVRELHAVLARASLRADGDEISADDLGLLDLSPPTSATSMERAMIEEALAGAGGSITKAARKIGWSRQKLYRRISALSIIP